MSQKKKTHEIDPTSPDVMVVDDDADLRLALLDLLQQADLVAVGAANGQEALALAGYSPPRLILLDMRMPVLDGWRFLESRGTDDALRGVPVVIISAEPVDDLPCTGVDARLAKPLDEGKLMATVGDLLARSPGNGTGTPARARSR